MKLKRSSFIIEIILILITALVFVSSNLYQGEFLDGLTYATISRNLAFHQGSAFHLFYNNFLYAHFYEHPPLFFWVESLFFKLFGDIYFLEKAIGLLFFICSSYLIKKIVYIKYQVHLSLFFIAVLSMLFFPYIWIFKNNMLESLLIPIVLLAYRVILQKDYSVIIRSILFALLFILAFLTKGPFCFFMLAMFFIESIQLPTINWKEILLFYLVLGICISISILLIINYEPLDTYLKSYFQIQLLKSLKGEREVSSRWIYINQLILVLLPLLILIIWKKIKKHNIDFSRYTTSISLVLLYSMSILVSPKQQPYYIVAIIPFIIIIIGDWMGLIYRHLEEISQRYSRYMIYSIFLAITVNIFLAYYTLTNYKSNIKKYIQVSDVLHKKSSLNFNISDELSANWYLIAVLSRYNNEQIQTNSTYQLRIKHVDTSLNSSDIILNDTYYLYYKQP
ncbi:MAG: hypothetical protein WCP57_05380 [Bacteroidota bacterium]